MIALSAPESMNRSTCFPSSLPGFRMGGFEKEPNKHGILTLDRHQLCDLFLHILCKLFLMGHLW